MFVSVEQARSESFDLCIIGSGPAGIILALEYARNRPTDRVLLLEAGETGTTKNPLDDSIVNANPRNHHDPYHCTNKGLGGTSKTWGGRCVMFDPIDFRPHGSVKDECTWDATFFDSVAEHFERAAEYFHCGRPVFDLSQVVEAPQRIAENFDSGIVCDTKLERWSLPTRFGREYRKQLEESTKISIVEGYYVSNLLCGESAGFVTTVRLRSLREGWDSGVVSAGTFVVAAGGRESTRLLMASLSVFDALKKVPEALGKYYQGHLTGKIAYVKFYGDKDQTDYGFVRDKDGVYLRRRFQFTDEALEEHGLLNVALWLDNPPYHDYTHGNGVLSLIYLMMITPLLRKKLLPPAIAEAHFKTFGEGPRAFRHLLNVLKGLPISILSPAWIFYRRYFQRRTLPGVFVRSSQNRYALVFHSEQTPRAENCLELSDDGVLSVYYTYSNEDVHSVIRAHALLDAELRNSGCGELEYMYDQGKIAGAMHKNCISGVHQIGTTRIGRNSSQGVVDFDLRVWGTSNLYVCSSSVFPTSSQANPTFFLGACAIRLAKTLAADRSARG